MVIYEVNLEVQQNIFKEYYDWLIEHTKAMLKLNGFQKVEIGLIDQEDKVEMEGKKQIRVSYTIASFEDLQDYFSTHAEKMRAEALSKFGNQFSAHRRVIKNIVVRDSR